MDDQKEKWKKDWERVRSYTSNTRTHAREVGVILNNFKFDLFIDCGPGLVGSEAWSIHDNLSDTCSIIGLEPQKERYEMLKDNGYPGKLINCCISDVSGDIEGYTGHIDGKSDFWINVTQDLLDAGAYKSDKVKSITIDEILQNRSEKAFVWADIEGSEYMMLKGAKKSLQQKKITGFFLELHEESSPDFVPGQGTVRDVLEYLGGYGFLCTRINGGGGTHSDWLFKLGEG